MSFKDDIYQKVMGGDMDELQPKFLVNLRNAIREELDAINTYSLLKEQAPDKVKGVIEEVLMDEVNHLGRLTGALLMYMNKETTSAYENGLQQKEPDSD